MGYFLRKQGGIPSFDSVCHPVMRMCVVNLSRQPWEADVAHSPAGLPYGYSPRSVSGGLRFMTPHGRER